MKFYEKIKSFIFAGDRTASQLETELEETKEKLSDTNRELNKMKLSLDDLKNKFDDLDLERRKLLDKLSDNEENLTSILSENRIRNGRKLEICCLIRRFIQR